MHLEVLSPGCAATDFFHLSSPRLVAVTNCEVPGTAWWQRTKSTTTRLLHTVFMLAFSREMARTETFERIPLTTKGEKQGGASCSVCVFRKASNDQVGFSKPTRTTCSLFRETTAHNLTHGFKCVLCNLNQILYKTRISKGYPFKPSVRKTPKVRQFFMCSVHLKMLENTRQLQHTTSNSYTEQKSNGSRPQDMHATRETTEPIKCDLDSKTLCQTLCDLVSTTGTRGKNMA
jgi:hypothetical protein